MSSDSSEHSPQGVTIVIPTLNRDGFLINALRDFVEQDHRPLEILVVDQSAEVPEDVQELASAHPELISYHRPAFRGLLKARNYGWQHARYDAIIYTDDDIRCDPDFVTKHLEALSRPNVSMVAGGLDEPYTGRQDGPPTGVFDRMTATPIPGFTPQGSFDVDHVPGGNFSMWREVAEGAGGFDEALDYGAALYEELELCLRVGKAGARLIYSGDARLTHLAAPSGGCRVEDVGRYMRSLVHNRTIVIRRNLRAPEQLSAFSHLLRLVVSHAVHYRRPEVFESALEGVKLGLAAAREAPRCTAFEAAGPVSFAVSPR